MFIYYSLGFAFSFLYLYTNDYIRNKINLPEKDYIQLIGKINSVIHANIVVVMSILLICDLIDSELWIQCLEITRGYCLYDTIMILYFTPKDRIMIIHHTLLFLGTYSNFISIYPEQAAYGLLAEITNQNLYFGWLIGFLIFRVINFTYLFIFAVYNCSYAEQLALIPILLMNYYWFCLLLHKALCSSVVISSDVIKRVVIDYLKTLVAL